MFFDDVMKIAERKAIVDFFEACQSKFEQKYYYLNLIYRYLYILKTHANFVQKVS